MQDYHVIVIDKNKSNPDKGALVYDLDTLLPFPCCFAHYTGAALRYNDNNNNLLTQFQRLYRIVPGASYLKYFLSDRSHMKKKVKKRSRHSSQVDRKIDDATHNSLLSSSGGGGEEVHSDNDDADDNTTTNKQIEEEQKQDEEFEYEWRAPPPPYPCILSKCTNTSNTHETTNSLPQYLSMTKAATCHSVDILKTKLERTAADEDDEEDKYGVVVTEDVFVQFFSAASYLI